MDKENLNEHCYLWNILYLMIILKTKIIMKDPVMFYWKRLKWKISTKKSQEEQFQPRCVAMDIYMLFATSDYSKNDIRFYMVVIFHYFAVFEILWKFHARIFQGQFIGKIQSGWSMKQRRSWGGFLRKFLRVFWVTLHFKVVIR